MKPRTRTSEGVSDRGKDHKLYPLGSVDPREADGHNPPPPMRAPPRAEKGSE